MPIFDGAKCDGIYNEFVGTHLVYFIDRLHTLMYISNFLFTFTHNLVIDSLLFVLVADSQQFLGMMLVRVVNQKTTRPNI